MIRRLWNKYVLWSRGYCTKHGIKKTLEIGYDVGAMYYECQQCHLERQQEQDADTERRLLALKGRTEQ